MHGVPVARRHLLAVMAGPDLEKGRVLREEWRGVVVPWQERAEFLCPRHRVIARQVAVETVPFDLTSVEGNVASAGVSCGHSQAAKMGWNSRPQTHRGDRGRCSA